MDRERGRSRRGVLRDAVTGALGTGLAVAAGASSPAFAAAREEQAAGAERLRVAVLLYDGFTALDAVGPYEVLCRLPGVRVTMVAREPGAGADGHG